MSIAAQKLMTAEEFAQLPEPTDGSQQELVKGEVQTMRPPGFRHGVCCLKVGRKLGNHADETDAGIVTSNDSGFVCERDPDTVYGPDIGFWKKDRVSELPKGYIEIPPDLAVEVVYPSDIQSKILERVIDFLKAGVSLVWIVDPELRVVTVYRSLDQARILEANATLSGEDVLPDFSCKVAELFD